MNTTMSLRRRLAARLPVTAAILGMGIVFASVLLFFYHGDSSTLFGIAGGMLFLVLGMWYAAHPFLVNERKNLVLRTEVGAFIGLVKELYAAGMVGDESEMLALREQMVGSVDRMVVAARDGGEIERDRQALRIAS